MDTTGLYMRRVIGILGIALPILSSLGAYMVGVPYIESISATHFINTYAIYETLLFATGLFLLSYKGYSIMDRILTIIGGIGAIMAVFFPAGTGSMAAFISPDAISRRLFPTYLISEQASGLIHAIGAGLFFITSALMFIFLFTKGDSTNPQKKKRNIVYYICGGLIFLFLIPIPLDAYVPDTSFLGSTYITEIIVLLALGVGWIVKSQFLLFKDK